MVCLLNATNKDTVGVWGAKAHEAILKKYLHDVADPENGLKAPGDGWSMKITNYPFPLSKLFKDSLKSAAGTTSAILMTIAFMMMSDSVV